MKICIFGAGAVGGNLAARLAEAGNDVCVVARGESLAAIRERGITIHAGNQRIHQRMPASDRPADLGVQNVVISTLKASSLAALADGIAPLLGTETIVVFAQNGIPWWYALGVNNHAAGSPRPLPDLSALDPHGALASAIPRQSIVGAVVHSENAIISPGVVLNTSPEKNRMLVANIDDTASERVSALRQDLTAASVQSPEVTSVRQQIWQKLLSNVVTGMTILVEEPTAAMLADAAMRRIAERLQAEMVTIAAAYGIRVEPSLPAVAASKKSSILQDYEQKRTMEVEAQWMAPLAFARSAMIAAPTLDAIAAMIAHRAAAKGLYAPAGFSVSHQR